MPEPTLRDIEKHLFRLARGQAEIKAEVAKLAAEQSGNLVLAAAVDELTNRVDHLADLHEASNQILTGVRSQGDSSFDLSVALSRRFRRLIQRLTERGVIDPASLRDDELESGEGHGESKLHAVEGPKP